MPELSVSHRYPQDADTVWLRIHDFADIQSWLPGVTGCQVEGEGVGAIRTVDVMDGSQVVERLEAFDEQQKLFRYSILSAGGLNEAHQFHATVSVKPTDDGGCEINWSASFSAAELASEQAEKIRAMAEKMYRFCLQNLEQVLKTP